jgi:hypothetical protein
MVTTGVLQQLADYAKQDTSLQPVNLGAINRTAWNRRAQWCAPEQASMPIRRAAANVFDFLTDYSQDRHGERVVASCEHKAGANALQRVCGAHGRCIPSALMASAARGGDGCTRRVRQQRLRRRSRRGVRPYRQVPPKATRHSGSVGLLASRHRKFAVAAKAMLPCVGGNACFLGVEDLGLRSIMSCTNLNLRYMRSKKSLATNAVGSLTLNGRS